jgi:hypothetical protein
LNTTTLQWVLTTSALLLSHLFNSPVSYLIFML